MDDDITDEQHRLQLLDTATCVRNDDLRFAWHGDGGQVVIDVDLA